MLLQLETGPINNNVIIFYGIAKWLQKVALFKEKLWSPQRNVKDRLEWESKRVFLLHVRSQEKVGSQNNEGHQQRKQETACASCVLQIIHTWNTTRVRPTFNVPNMLLSSSFSSLAHSILLFVLSMGRRVVNRVWPIVSWLTNG